MKKILSLILACLMLSLSLVGCQTTLNEDEESDGTVALDEQDSVLPDMDWGGKEMKIMACVNGLVGNIFEASDYTNQVEAEVYARNDYLEKTYNFTISCQGAVYGQWPSDVVRTEATAGESSYDIIMDAVRSMKGALSQFLYADLTELDYIDWNAKGWLKDANDSLDVMGYRFLCTGDANLYEKSGAVMMYYNRNMMESIQEEDIRQLALNGKWTMEEMYGLMKKAAQEDSATGEMMVYGLVHSEHEAFYNYLTTGYGMKIVTENADGALSFSFDDPTAMEHAINAVNNVLKFYSAHETYNQANYYATPKALDIFTQESSLFMPYLLCEMKTFRNAGLDYGVLPLPKSDETDEYRSAYLTGDTQLFAIPCFAADTNFSAFVLQAMMENSEEIIHIYIEEQCKLRGSYDEVDYDLISLALSNFVYDLGGIFDWGAIKTWIFIDRYDGNQAIQSIPVSGTNNLATSWAEKRNLAYKELNDFLTHFN